MDKKHLTLGLPKVFGLVWLRREWIKERVVTLQMGAGSQVSMGGDFYILEG